MLTSSHPVADAAALGLGKTPFKNAQPSVNDSVSLPALNDPVEPLAGGVVAFWAWTVFIISIRQKMVSILVIISTKYTSETLCKLLWTKFVG